LEEELQISHPNAVTIAKKVDELIFKRIREIIVSDEKTNINLDNEFENNNDFNDATKKLIDDIEDRADNNLSFKEKFNKVTVKKEEERTVDPYLEPID
jgi:hypothetical protein